MGATDFELDGVWRWRSDNTVAAVYTRKVGGLKFADREPNNNQSNEHCLELISIGGNDLNCAEIRKFICEKSGTLASFL